jgi:hypothetical protein
MATSGSHTHGPPPLPEPKTPLWLTAVGGILFVGVAICWASRPADPAATEATAAAATATAATATAAAGTASVPTPSAAASVMQRALHPRRPAR